MPLVSRVSVFVLTFLAVFYCTMSFFRSAFNFLTKRSSKNKCPVQHVEGADRWLIDSSVLCCPICYSIYDKAPLILTCGHTFCRKCLMHIEPSQRLNGNALIPCPLCREIVVLSRSAPNYVVEDLLNTVEQLVEEAPAKVLDANLRAMKDRLQERVKELESEKSRLEKEVAEERKRLENVLTALFLIGGVYALGTLVRWFFF